MAPTKGVATSTPIRNPPSISRRFEIAAESAARGNGQPGSSPAGVRGTVRTRRTRRRTLHHARPLAAAALLLLAVPSLPGCAAGSAAGAADAPAPAVTSAGDSGAVRLHPLPIGAPAFAGRWKIELGPVAWAQRDQVLAANVDPAPLPEHYGWALLPITFVNLSDGAATPGQFEVILHAGGWDVSHREVGRYLTRMPAEFHPTELEPDASVTGNLGFWLPDTAAADPKCRIELHTMSGGYGSDPQVFWFTCS